MGSKHERLQRLAGALPVPPLFALAEADLARLWTNHAQMRAGVERKLQQIHATAAAFLDEHVREVQQLLQPVWAPGAHERIEHWLRQAGIAPSEPVAVRSSDSGEDSLRHSFAGIFLTRLDVVGIGAIQRAVEQVWASAFARPAILERIRSGTLQHASSMTVIVQRMVRARWAGVAFSHDPVAGEATCTIEAVPGLGEGLVSGAERGSLARVHAGVIRQRDPGLPEELVAGVAQLTDRVRAALREEAVDIEWAADGSQLWLLQARPITTVQRSAACSEPVLEVAHLYRADDADIGPFRPLPGFAQYFRGKRKPLADFARSIGLPEAASLLVRANAGGIAAKGELLLAALKGPQLVLDASDRVRQQIVPRELLPQRLRELLGHQPAVFVVREFIQGTAGLISQPSATPGQVLCEWSTDGLLCINRGIAATQSFVVGPAGAPAGAIGRENPFGPAHRRVLHEATVLAQGVFGRAQLEWVLQGDDLFLIDFSPLENVCVVAGEDGARVISPGFATGHPMVIEATRDLEQLSIAACVSLTDIPDPDAVGGSVAKLYGSMRAHGAPMIVVSPRPYAALAPLVPFSAGFIFEQAATLCHLAILLREHGVPAMESPQLYQQALRSAGERIVLDASSKTFREIDA